MTTRMKKKPEDYPQFNFRVPTHADKATLIVMIKRTQKILNAKVPSTEKKYGKNDVISWALKIGLKTLQEKNRGTR